MSTEEALERAAREFTKHSGPGSDPRERTVFANDLRAAALRYHAEAPETKAMVLGAIEFDRSVRDHLTMGVLSAGMLVAIGLGLVGAPSGIVAMATWNIFVVFDIVRRRRQRRKTHTR